MSQPGGAAFLPFLKKKPASTPQPQPYKEEEDPLALPIPAAKSSGKLSNHAANLKFISQLNGKQNAKAANGHAPALKARPAMPPSKGTSVAGTARPLGPAGKGLQPWPTGLAAAAAGKPAAAKLDAEKKRLRQLQRLAALTVLAPKEAPPEVLAKYEEAKQKAAAIQRQQELQAKRKAELEQQRQQQMQLRRQQEQERQRILAEKQRLHAAKLGGASRPPFAGAAISPSSLASSSTAPASSKAATAVNGNVRQLSQAAPNSQPSRDPYAGLHPKQRAFLLARKREREGRMGGRRSPVPGNGYGHGGGGGAWSGDEYDEYEDSLDGFIDDGDEEDWRKELRGLTGYDPTKYNDSLFNDRMMEASAAEIAAEERRSARMGKAEDEREAELEARRLEAKEAKKKSRKKASAFLDD